MTIHSRFLLNSLFFRNSELACGMIEGMHGLELVLHDDHRAQHAAGGPAYSSSLIVSLRRLVHICQLCITNADNITS